MDKILTISIAAYQAEKTIRDALDSLIVPEIIDMLEIFVVDDGGTDSTLDIVKGYAARYPKSIIPVHKENGGFGSVQNYVMKHATGKYFKILDGDDWFEKGAMKAFVTQLEKEEGDVVVSGMRTFREKEGLSEDVSAFEVSKIQNLAVNTPGSHLGLPNITYKTSILIKSELVLPENMLYTDTIYFYLPFTVAKTIRYYQVNLYCYRIGREGQSVSTQSIQKHIEDLVSISLIISEHFHNKGINCENREYLLRVCGITGRTCIKYLFRCGINRNTLKLLRKYDNEMKLRAPEVFTDIAGKNYGHSGILIKVIRSTGYLAFWLLKMVPSYTNRETI